MTNTNETGTTDAGGLLSDFLTENDLAAELNVTKDTLRRWRSLGEAPAITTIGRKIFYRRDTLHEWLASRQVDAVGM